MQLPDVGLGQGDILVLAGLRRPGEHEGLLALRLDQAPPERGHQAGLGLGAEPAGGVEHPGHQHLGDRVDQAGAADADGRRAADRLADHVLADLDLLDSADRAAHAVANLGALERRPGRRRTGHQTIARAHDHLAVGADVDQAAGLGAVVDAGRQHRGHGVGADEAGHDRQQADPRPGQGLEEHVATRRHHGAAHHRRIGREPDVGRIDAEEDVVHAGVADDHHLVHVAKFDTGLGAGLLGVAVDRVQHLGAQGLQLLGRELGVGDARHQIAAIDRLRVDAADRGQLRAGLQVHQRADDAGGADVESHAVLLAAGVAGLDIDDFAVEAGDREPPALGAQRAGQFAQQFERHRDLGVEAEREGHLLQVRGLVVLVVRGLGLDETFLDARIEPDPMGGLDAPGPHQELVPDLGLGRGHHDPAIGDHLGLAGQAEALVHLVMAELDLVHDGRRRQVAVEHLDPATAALAAPAAGRRQLEPGGLSDLEEGLADGRGPLSVRGLSGRIDEGDGHAVAHVRPSWFNTKGP